MIIITEKLENQGRVRFWDVWEANRTDERYER